jgi:hypothetical protein
MEEKIATYGNERRGGRRYRARGMEQIGWNVFYFKGEKKATCTGGRKYHIIQRDPELQVEHYRLD